MRELREISTETPLALPCSSPMVKYDATTYMDETADHRVTYGNPHRQGAVFYHNNHPRDLAPLD
jgi:hypothetical protein